MPPLRIWSRQVKRTSKKICVSIWRWKTFIVIHLWVLLSVADGGLRPPFVVYTGFKTTPPQCVLLVINTNEVIRAEQSSSLWRQTNKPIHILRLDQLFFYYFFGLVSPPLNLHHNESRALKTVRGSTLYSNI